MCAVVYIDGSNHAGVSAAVGVRIFTNGEVHEMSHKYESPKHSLPHETLAFIEAVKHLVDRNIPPHEVSFYTDDQFIAYYNHNPGLKVWQNAVGMIKSLCRKFYTAELAQVVLEYLHNSRVNKIKGHAYLVDNHRVDYLAHCALRDKTPDSYDVWLYKPQRKWVSTEKCIDVFFPFTTMEELAELA